MNILIELPSCIIIIEEMGVTRLNYLLDRDIVITDLIRETLLKKNVKHLLIDASSYLFYLLDFCSLPDDFVGPTVKDHTGQSLEDLQDLRSQQLPYQPQVLPTSDDFLMNRKYAGTYDELVAIAKKDIEGLKAMNFQLIFFFDRHVPQRVKPSTDDQNCKEDVMEERVASFKDFAMQFRKKQKLEAWRELKRVVTQQIVVFDESKLPVPLFAMKQFETFLQKERNTLNIEINCEIGEADPKILAQALALRAQGKEYYVYSYDTDFAAMRDCPLIKFRCMNSISDESIEAIVWRRSRIAEYLDISEVGFVEFCLVMGCDYTKHIDRSTLAYGPRQGLQQMTESELFDLIRHHPNQKVITLPNSMDEHSHQRQELHLNYARAFFQGDSLEVHEHELQTLMQIHQHSALLMVAEQRNQSHNRDKDGNESTEEDDEEDDNEEVGAQSARQQEVSNPDEFFEIVNLSRQCKDLIDVWESNQQRQSSPTVYSALEFLRSRMHDGCIRLGNDGYVTSLHPDYLHVVITPQHLQAFDHMLADLLAYEGFLVNLQNGLVTEAHRPRQLVIASDEMPQWEDIQVAYFYQKVIQYLQLDDIFEPKQLFHGKLFQCYCNQFRVSSVLSKPDDNEQELEDRKEGRKKLLPIYHQKKEIIKLVEKNQITLINGRTGCGKSTVVPLFLYEYRKLLSPDQNVKLLVIEPRRVAAKNLFDRVKQEVNREWIANCDPPIIGMCRGYEHPIDVDKANVIFTTAGYVIAKYLQNMAALGEVYTHIILDEVHERTMDYDMLLLFLKEVLLSNGSKLKLILMSATPDQNLYDQFFGIPVAQATIDSNVYPLEIHHINSDSFRALTANMSRGFLDICNSIDHYSEEERRKILEARNRGESFRRRIANVFFQWQCEAMVSLLENIRNISSKRIKGVLIFVSGIGEIFTVKKYLKRLSYKRDTDVLWYHSQVEGNSKFDDLRAKEEGKASPTNSTETILEAAPKMRIIIATNVLESAVNIPDIDLVFCFGAQNVKEYDPRNPYRISLVNTWISKDSARQRAGRTGRVSSGLVFRLYSEGLHNDVFDDRIIPEVETIPLQDSLLKIVDATKLLATKHPLKDIRNVFSRLPGMMHLNEAMSHQLQTRITDAIEDLLSLKLVKQYSAELLILTPMGKFCSAMSMSIRLSRLIYYGILLGVEYESTIIAAALSLPTAQIPFRAPSTLYKYDHPDYLNIMIRTCFKAKMKLDQGYLSDVFQLFTLFKNYDEISNENHKAGTLTRDTGIPHKPEISLWDFHNAAFLNVDKMDRFHRIGKQHLVDIQHATNAACGKTHIDRRPPKVVTRDFTFKELNEERVALLRMILVWTCEGNILKSQSQPRRLPDNVILIKDHPKFDHRKAIELFPSNPKFTRVAREIVEFPYRSTSEELWPILINGLTVMMQRNEVEVAMIWRNMSVGEQQLYILGSSSLAEKVQSAFLLDQTAATIVPAPSNPTYQLWVIPSSLVQHIEFQFAREYFESSLEVYLPTQGNWSVRTQNVQHTVLLQSLRSTGIVGENELPERHNLNGFLLPSNSKEDLGYVILRFKPNKVVNGIKDLPLSVRLSNAYSLMRRPRCLTIGGYDVYRTDKKTPFESMSSIKLGVYPNTGQWLIARPNANASRYSLDQSWYPTGMEDCSSISWSNLRMVDAENVARPVYAVAGLVIKSNVKVDQEAHHARRAVLLDANRHQQEWTTQRQQEHEEGLRYMSTHVSVIPYHEKWIEAMLAFVEGKDDQTTVLGNNLIKLRRLLDGIHQPALNSTFRKIVLQFHQDLIRGNTEHPLSFPVV